LFALWMMLVALIPGKQIFDSETTIERLEAQERTSVDAVRSLNEIRGEHARLIAKLNFFNQLEAEHVATMDLLNEVTTLLSDNTWVKRFDLKNDKLTIQGESNKASEIPGILEGSTIFSAPKFSSPVTRNNATGHDRFQIVVTIDSSARS
jgi:general secretion pathway protein L